MTESWRRLPRDEFPSVYPCDAVHGRLSRGYIRSVSPEMSDCVMVFQLLSGTNGRWAGDCQALICRPGEALNQGSTGAQLDAFVAHTRVPKRHSSCGGWRMRRTDGRHPRSPPWEISKPRGAAAWVS